MNVKIIAPQTEAQANATIFTSHRFCNSLHIKNR
jgi:hypothetical protein